MFPRFLGAILCVLILLGGAACGTQQSTALRDLETKSPSPEATPQGFPDFGAVLRQGSDAAEFLIQQPGAHFATDLPYAGCIASGGHADLTPGGLQAGPRSLDHAAYSIYRLTYDPLSAPVKLSLDCDAPPAGQCWIGLSDWTKSRWDWQVLPESNELELSDPQRFVNGQQQCYVAVVLFGDSACQLSTIGFGTPPPNSEGYTLIAPLFDTNTYLIDMDGNIVHNWSSDYTPGASAVLLPNGNLLRGANLPNAKFGSGGRAGRIEEFNWNGQLVWSYQLSTSKESTHHDFKLLPNGNVLLITWQYVDDADIIALGRNPLYISSSGFIADAVLEVQPTLPMGGTIVWEWRAIDHLVQDFDAEKANYAVPSEHPELIDINFDPGLDSDWIHVNALSYNPALDQVMVTTPNYSEIWVIDHSTTTAEAATHSGGHSGHGGDLLYRWGNPRAYGAGTDLDQQVNFCHNGQWIEDGLDGAGDILIFDNRPSSFEANQSYSSLVQITPPLNPDGSYERTAPAYGPSTPTWQYVADPPESFFSPVMSGVQRLPGGGTLSCLGTSGHVYELDANKNIVWDYQTTLDDEATTFVFRALRYTYDFPGVANLLTP